MRALLFSGGIDSTSLAWIERPDELVFVDYGQVAAAGEERAARSIAAAIGIPLEILRADLAPFGAGTMSGRATIAPEAPEFWPFRNQMLVTLAAMAYGSRAPVELLIGTVSGDLIHPDGTAAFVDAMNRVLRTQGAFSLSAPALGIDAQELLARADLPTCVLGWTFSCHTGEWACGRCRGCWKHDELKRSVASR